MGDVVVIPVALWHSANVGELYYVWTAGFTFYVIEYPGSECFERAKVGIWRDVIERFQTNSTVMNCRTI